MGKYTFTAAWLAASSLAAADASPRTLAKALTFHAPFDGGIDARFALGDKRLYAAPSYKEQDSAKPGIEGTEIELARGEGRFGDALRFKKKNTRAVFFRAEKNVSFAAANWTGTVSFWLNLNPDLDLEPGFCDPIQVTDKAYNDSAIWVDFTKDDKPRHMRLGVFGELKAWNPKNLASDANQDFIKRLVAVSKPPFERGKWTHIAITYSGLGGGKGWAKLYLNGELQGTAENIAEPFAWDLARGALRLGVNYTGLFDELAVFNRALSGAEVKTLYGLKKGLAGIVRPR
jgi:hypothetical protein